MMYSLQGAPGRYRSLYRTGGAFPYTELQADPEKVKKLSFQSSELDHQIQPFARDRLIRRNDANVNSLLFTPSYFRTEEAHHAQKATAVAPRSFLKFIPAPRLKIDCEFLYSLGAHAII